MEKLTKERAFDLTIELWEWLAKTGRASKVDWPEFKAYGMETIASNCFLCEYTDGKAGRAAPWDRCLLHCPYCKVFGHCTEAGSPLSRWGDSRTSYGRKKHAKVLLAQIRELKMDEAEKCRT